jgi:hypothetical protein
VSQDFLLQVFFHESPSPKPLKITLKSFRIFLKIRRDIRKSRCTTGVNDIGGNFAPGVNDTSDKIAAGISDTGGKFCHQFRLCCWHGGKFATGVNDIGGKFAAGVNDAGGKLSPVSTTPVANNGNNIRLQKS